MVVANEKEARQSLSIRVPSRIEIEGATINPA
jgi:hypothetical protein